MKLELCKDAVTKVDLPEFSLCKGDIVKLVDELQAVDGSPWYAVEVFGAFGRHRRKGHGPRIPNSTAPQR